MKPKQESTKKPMPERPVLVKLTPSQINFLEQLLERYPLQGQANALGPILLRIHEIRATLLRALPKERTKK